MGILSDARQALVELPADVLRERLALANDIIASLQLKVTSLEEEKLALQEEKSALQLENADFKLRLSVLSSEKENLQSIAQKAELDNQNLRQELQDCKDRIPLLRHGSPPGASNVRVTETGTKSKRIF